MTAGACNTLLPLSATSSAPALPALAVTPLWSKSSGEVEALAVVAPDGRTFLARVDERSPNRLLLKDTRNGRMYALLTNLDKLDVQRRPQMESIFRTPGWQQRLVQL